MDEDSAITFTADGEPGLSLPKGNDLEEPTLGAVVAAAIFMFLADNPAIVQEAIETFAERYGRAKAAEKVN